MVYVRQTASLSKNSPDEPLGHGARGYEGYMIRYNSRAKRKNGSSYLKSSVGKLCFLTHLDQRLILKNVFYVGIMKNSCFYVSGSQTDVYLGFFPKISDLHAHSAAQNDAL